MKIVMRGVEFRTERYRSGIESAAAKEPTFTQRTLFDNWSNEGISYMSFLGELIKAVRGEFRRKPPQLEIAVRCFKRKVTNKLRALHDTNNLRIFDGNDGGVIRGPKKSRAKYENRETGNLSCQVKYLNDEKLEVPYYRAVFNTRDHAFEIQDDLTVHLIGYESPFMRKRKKRKNSDIGSRAISCDLVGLTSDNRVLCIEGKAKPHNDATDIVYGILESFAYGVCVHYLLSGQHRRAAFVNEVVACATEFRTPIQAVETENLTAAFSLAAPKEYFCEFFNPKQLTKRKAGKRLGEARDLMSVLQSIGGPKWAGFLVVEPPCCVDSFERIADGTINGIHLIEPHFNEPMTATLANSIDDLANLLA